MINFYRRKTGRKLFGFGDLIGDVPIRGEALSALQKNIVLNAGFNLVDINQESEINDSNYFLFDDDLVFSPAFVMKVVAYAKEAKGAGSLRFTVRKNSFNDRFCLPRFKNAVEDLKFPFYFISEEKRIFKDVVIEQKIYKNEVTVPKQIVSDGSYHYDQCDTFIMQILSPFHLLHSNLAFIFLRYLGLRSLFPERIIQRWFPTNSKIFFRALKSKNKIGKNCKIHPTAILEGCEIGDNVTIGAYSVVRLSQVGSGSTLEEHTLVKYSVLGQNNYVSNGNQINACMTFDEAFLIHGPYQFSIFGKQSTVMAVINCDYRLDQKTIQIPTDHGLLDSKQPLLGIAYGHGAKVGGGNIILPGRIVPNHYRLAPPNFTKTSFEKIELENASL